MWRVDIIIHFLSYRKLGVSPAKAMPSFKAVGIDLSTMSGGRRSEVAPVWFGKELLTELTSEDSSVRKALEKLRGKSKHHSNKKKYKPSSSATPKRYEVSGHARAKPCVVSHRIAGRISDFLATWESLTSDPVVLEWVKGYKLQFLAGPPVRRVSVEFNEPPSNLYPEIEKLLDKGAIELTPKTTAVFKASLFGIPKKDGTTRLIVNLKPLNAYLEIPHFKMEGLYIIPDLVFKGDYCCKLDMSDAYFAVNVDPKDRAFLAFTWKQEVYQFTCLPFGLATAPWVYTKLMTVLAENLRSQGIRLIHYLDDWAFFADSAEALQSHIAVALELFASVGLRVNMEKSITSPVQEMEFLGLLINCQVAHFAIPPKKIVDIVTCAQRLLNGHSLLAVDVANFLGKANFLTPAVPLGPLKLRNLQRALNKVIRHDDPSSYQLPIALGDAARTDLGWWLQHTATLESAPWARFSPELIITSDASKLGWGAVCCGKRIGGRWKKAEKSEHINFLELQASFFALKIFAASWRNLDVLLELDNTSAVAYIRNLGGVKSCKLSDLACELHTWAGKRNIRIFATYRPGVLNEIADWESRNTTRESAEFSLDNTAAQQIFDKFGQPEVDLFATRLNCKVSKFCAFFPDPEAWRIDCFAQSWLGIFGYAFPPFALIPRVIRKAVEDKATLLLVTPAWRTQAWFPLALRWATEPPMILAKRPNLITDPEGQEHPLLQQKNFRLLVWRICWTTGKSRASPGIVLPC